MGQQGYRGRKGKFCWVSTLVGSSSLAVGSNCLLDRGRRGRSQKSDAGAQLLGAVAEGSAAAGGELLPEGVCVGVRAPMWVVGGEAGGCRGRWMAES